MIHSKSTILFLKTTIFFVVILMINPSHSTFSIVAVDSVTGEVGSAGATCGDSVIWPNTPGAKIISDLIPGIGAIHTQSYHRDQNQANARTRMLAGDSPQEIMDWVTANDIQNDPSIRQYGVVDFNNGSPRSSAYTGANCLDYKNHLLGSNYAIQGNILLGREILDSIEARFINTPGSLALKLMSALQGANVIGADSRCQDDRTSSLSSFVRVAKPNDDENSMYLDLNVGATANRVEPIDELQKQFDTWKANLPIKQEVFKPDYKIIIRQHYVYLELDHEIVDRISIYSSGGKLIQEIIPNKQIQKIILEKKGMYFLVLSKNGMKISSKPFIYLSQ